MSKSLALPKGKKVAKPNRDSDYVSKRGIHYWWAPEWVRDLNGTICRIMPITVADDAVDLHMISKTGNASFIRGSIQHEFQRWHSDNHIDYILLGMDYSDLKLEDWDYE